MVNNKMKKLFFIYISELLRLYAPRNDGKKRLLPASQARSRNDGKVDFMDYFAARNDKKRDL
jgi:hypothetical protein